MRVGAALTTPGRVGTARRRGSGQRDEKVYARNQCLTPLNGPPAQIWRIWAGRGAYLPPAVGVGCLCICQAAVGDWSSGLLMWWYSSASMTRQSWLDRCRLRLRIAARGVLPSAILRS